MSSVLSETTLYQKMSTFCSQFGAQMTAAKERIRNGEPLDGVLDELFLLTFSDLCRTLGCPLDPNTAMNDQQMWSQMLNCVTTSMEDGGEDDDGYEDEDQADTGFSKQMIPIQQQPTQKLFFCEYPDCGKSYRRYTDLKSHFLRHNAAKLFECAWPDCTFKSTYSSSVGEHIGKLHFKCQTRGPERDDYLDEAKKWIRKINDDGSSNFGNVSSPFPTGPFICCDRTFSNSYNLNKHQSSRKCVKSMQNLQQPQQNLSNSFTEAAAAAVAAFSQHPSGYDTSNGIFKKVKGDEFDDDDDSDE